MYQDAYNNNDDITTILDWLYLKYTNRRNIDQIILFVRLSPFFLSTILTT